MLVAKNSVFQFTKNSVLLFTDYNIRSKAAKKRWSKPKENKNGI
jgi:hypothetical protein